VPWTREKANIRQLADNVKKEMKQREPKRNPHNHDDPPRRATQSLHYRAHIPVGGKSPRWHVINKIAYARHAQPVEEQTPELPTPSPGNRKTPTG
jgi:hypothetical protein